MGRAKKPRGKRVPDEAPDREEVLEERLRIERDAAAELAKTKDDFLATISHEMRTPMNAIIGMAGLISETPLTGEQLDYVHTLRVNSEHLLGLIDDILDYAKIEAGKLSLEPRPFELAECVEDSLDLAAPNAAKSGIKLTHNIAPGIPEIIEGDVSRLRQVLGNLLINAVKFTPEGSVRLEVSGERAPKGKYALKFVVSDTGIGIPPETLPLLFKPFVQADPTATRRYGGAGLGLAICKRLADIMGGTLSVESKVGVGSQFTLQLVCAGFPDRRSRPRTEPLDLTGKEVFCVSGRKRGRLALVAQLKSWNANISFADSAEQLLEWLDRGDAADLVIMDFDKSGTQVPELARDLRQRAKKERLPTLLLTASEFDETVVARDLVDAIVVKPVRPRTLGRRINELLRHQGGVRRPGGAASRSAAATRFLLVDDLEDNVKLATLLLRKLGYTNVDVAGNGKEAVRAVEKKAYDAVLMDVMMPEMDGLEATREIRQRFPHKRYPLIIAMTAKVMPGDRELCLEAGMDDYISKPIRIAQLRDTLQKHLGRAPAS